MRRDTPMGRDTPTGRDTPVMTHNENLHVKVMAVSGSKLSRFPLVCNPFFQIVLVPVSLNLVACTSSYGRF